MKIINRWLLLAISFGIPNTIQARSLFRPELPRFFSADNDKIQYVGRIDFTDRALPRFWAPGVYIRIAFTGAACNIMLNDQAQGNNHNYISIQVDDLPVTRIKLKNKTDTINITAGMIAKQHIIVICKSTEANIGYLEFAGIRCNELLDPPALPKRKMEFFGDSITSGTGSDAGNIPCNTGAWYDQHNAYMSYGPLTARALDASWHLTAFAGIGLTRSCCNMKVVMPDVYDKVSLAENRIEWDFNLYQPDVVTICLGQNDGVRDSVTFCKAYVDLIDIFRIHYPKATMICMDSPMADEKLVKVQKSYISAISRTLNNAGDKNIYPFFVSRRYHSGCGDHPSLMEHRLIAAELTAFIAQIKKW
jgi:lysophospholipase L1-like esterase